jgi:hypothetical protein
MGRNVAMCARALLADFDELQVLDELADGRALRRLLDGPLHDPLARQPWERRPTVHKIGS